MSATVAGISHGYCCCRAYDVVSVRALSLSEFRTPASSSSQRSDRTHRRLSAGMAAVAVPSGSNGAPFGRPAVPDGEGRSKTLLEALPYLRTSELPADYKASEMDRPSMAHDEWVDTTDLPLLDLSRVASDRAGLVQQVGTAATEWGFFQILNHGLSLEFLQELHDQGMSFFQLPGERKLKAVSSQNQSVYSGDNSKHKSSSLNWAESLGINLPDLDHVVSSVWPEGNQTFKDTILKFCAAAEAVNKLLMELLAESVGLPTDFFSKHLNDRRTLFYRWNFYPACPQPSDILGANAHTDGCSLTILQQDKVGGLQIQKDGHWVGIRPIEGALVVNVGDTLHAWTNGTFKSVLHRAVVNRSVHRLSLALFLSVDGTLPITAPEELIDEEHPRLFKPFNQMDYVMHVINTRKMEEGTTPKSKDGLLYLEGFKILDHQ